MSRLLPCAAFLVSTLSLPLSAQTPPPTVVQPAEEHEGWAALEPGLGFQVNSVFGYYVGGQRGQTLSMDYSVLF